MEDYPRGQIEFERRFDTEAACQAYLAALRWPDGFVCPGCQGRQAWRMKRGLWLCQSCRRQVSVTAGTIFQDTHSPLTLWFRAIWYVTSQKNGASALGIQRVLGLGSYQTAWAWLHKLRRAMARPGRDPLGGVVEVDEAYVGGLEEGRHGRRTQKKALVVVAAEENGAGIGRIRLRRVADLSRASLHGFIQAAIAPASTVRTDGWPSYAGLDALGYRHRVQPVRGRKDVLEQLLPRVHRVVALLKRRLLGTHQGAVSQSHLDYYLDEFTFRFNRRSSRSRGKLFFRLVQQAVQIEPQPYQTLIGPRQVGRG